MSLHPEPIGTIPAETARVARAAFPKGTVVMRLRDEFGTLYGDEDFGRLYPSRGQPAPAGAGPMAAGPGHGLPVPREPQRPAGGRCGARPDRPEVRARARAHGPEFPLRRA